MKSVRRKPATLSEQLDKAVDRIMTDREARLPKVNSRIAAILRVAGDLRDLPKEDFKARLKREIIQRAQSMNAMTAPAASSKKYIPAGSHSVNACLVVKDPPRAIDFYKHAFGATEVMRLADPSGNVMHAQIQIGDSQIDIAPEESNYNLSPDTLGGSSVVMGLYVEDVDAFAERAIAAGCKVIFPVADQFYGDRGGRLADPFGHLWIVSTHKEDVTPEEMSRRAEAWMKEASAAETKPPIEFGAAPEGFHTLTPYLQVQGAAKMIDFLKTAFGAQEDFRVPMPDGSIGHSQLRIEGSMIEVADATPEYKPNPTAIWLFVGDADAVYRRALKAGATSLNEPTDQDYGERSASIVDPFGNYWYIATPHKDAAPAPKELRSVTPYLHPKGTPKVIDFLKEAFDAEEIFRAQDPAGTVHHAKLRIGDSIIAMGEAHGPYQPMPPALHLYVKDADLVYERALKAGATSLSGPRDAYGDRSAHVADPFGNTWYIATHKQDLVIENLELEASALESPRRPGSIMPFMYSENAEAAADFCKKVFRANEIHRIVQPGGKVSHVQIAIGQTNVMLRDATTPDLADYVKKGFAGTPHSFGGTPLALYIYVDDADAAYKRALDEGSLVVDALEDKEWGDRCGGVKDPFGHIWYIATPLKDVSH